MSTPQARIESGFGAASTAAEVIRGCDLGGKIAVVTGGYSGIGRETTRALRSAGAKVIVPARDHDKAATALEELDGVEIEAMDLLDPASIDAFAERFLASGRPLHILVNSAGIMACPLARDARGYESQFATNHLGHFQLVARLWPALRQANGARVVSVSSWGHRHSPILSEDLNFERRDYDRWSAYGQSKTANILFSLALEARGMAEGMRAFSLHPGSIVGTGLEKHLSLAIRQVGSMSLGVMSYAVDPGAADRLWRLSEQLLGLEQCDSA
jgi:NAD(P)-dependent dehydrogenase (short-subunit alcohol dehydrogenase family)